MASSPLPTRIDSNPLSAVVELRFDSTKGPIEEYKDLLSHSFPKHSIKPTLVNGAIDENNPTHVFANDNYHISVNKKALSFENIGDYQLWGNYFELIQNVLGKVFETKKILHVDRIGVRYTTIFGNASSISEALNVKIEFPLSGFKQSSTLCRKELNRKDICININVGEGVQAVSRNRVLNGILVDIDAYTNSTFDTSIRKDIFDKIDELHTQEKQIFFQLLNPDFLTKLNPIY
ncbi:MAG: TIGR04255 family protein [Bacteroidota bacterium]